MTTAAVTTGDDLGVRVDVAGEGTSVTPIVGARDGAGPTPEEYAAGFEMALRIADSGSLRGAQSDGGLLGASDAGRCTNKAVYTVKQTPPSNVVKKGKALVGTALHAVWLPHLQALNPHLLIEHSLTVTLPSGRQIPVHPDIIDPAEPSVTDLKTVGDLAYVRRAGVGEDRQMQRALYYLAAHQAGLVPLEGTVRNLFVSMTDSDDIYVQQEPFSMEWIEKADEWFGTVAYHVEHDEEGARDAQPHFCERFCPWFDVCKPPLMDAMGQLSSPALREAVQVTHEAIEERKRWEKVEKDGKTKLAGISGRADDLMVISTWVNTGKGYWRTDTRQVES